LFLWLLFPSLAKGALYFGTKGRAVRFFHLLDRSAPFSFPVSVFSCVGSLLIIPFPSVVPFDAGFLFFSPLDFLLDFSLIAPSTRGSLLFFALPRI